MLSDPTMPIDDRDFELLSAYLDQALSPAERAALELRLDTEPELRRALDELSATRRLLRALPRLRSPRNFTLTPAQVRRPLVVSFVSSPMVTMVSAAAAVVLIVAGVLLSVASNGRLDDPNMNMVAVAPTVIQAATVQSTVSFDETTTIQAEETENEGLPNTIPSSPLGDLSHQGAESTQSAQAPQARDQTTQTLAAMQTAIPTGMPTAIFTFEPFSAVPSDEMSDAASSAAASSAAQSAAPSQRPADPPAAMMAVPSAAPMTSPTASPSRSRTPAPMGTAQPPPVTLFEAAPVQPELPGETFAATGAGGAVADNAADMMDGMVAGETTIEPYSDDMGTTAGAIANATADILGGADMLYATSTIATTAGRMMQATGVPSTQQGFSEPDEVASAATTTPLLTNPPPTSTPAPTQTVSPSPEAQVERADDITVSQPPDTSVSPLLIIGGLLGVFALITLLIRRLTR